MEPSPPYTRIVEVYETLVVDDVYRDWADFVIDAWEGGGGTVRHVLDIGCGTGLLAEQLVDRGLRVTGVDASQDMLDRARARLAGRAELALSTLPDLDVGGPFDAAVSTFDTLNYIDTGDLPRSLAAIAAVLRPGATFVFDVHTDAMLTFCQENPVISGERAGWSYTLLTTVDAPSRTCVSSFDAHPLDAADPKAAFAEQHTQFFHADATIESSLAEAGFEVLSVTDEYTSAPVTGSTLRASWTARRVR